MRVIFAGTPDFAARHLLALLDTSDLDVVAVYTQPDRPAGRGKKIQASPVKELALEHNIPIEQPASLKSTDVQTQLASYQADIMVVVAYGLLLPQPVLDIPRLGCINVHGSLLPRWRGAAPIQRAIWAGDCETGVTIMQMDAGLDTGPMLAKAHIAIEKQDTSATLYEKLACLGPTALIETLRKIKIGGIRPVPQEDKFATYAQKLSTEEALLNWHEPAEFLERCVRAFTPWPGSRFLLRGEAIKLWGCSVAEVPNTAVAGTILRADKQGILVQCGEKALNLEFLQPPGKKAMAAADLLNARREHFIPGHILSVQWMSDE